jgi:hypothetical protein
MRVDIPRIALCALAFLLLAAGNEPTATVAVEGVPLSYRDVLQLTALALGGSGLAQGAIVKQAAEMPKSSPYIYYAGTDAGGKPIVWISAAIRSNSKPSAAEMAEMVREEEQMGLVVMLVTGQGNPEIRSLYARVQSDPTRLAALGAELRDAMTQMSAKTVEYSDDQRRWIFQNISAGTPRDRAEEMLQAHGLTASASGETTIVNLPGSFQPGCYFSSNVILTFKSSALYKIDLSQPIPNCL